MQIYEAEHVILKENRDNKGNKVRKVSKVSKDDKDRGKAKWQRDEGRSTKYKEARLSSCFFRILDFQIR